MSRTLLACPAPAPYSSTIVPSNVGTSDSGRLLKHEQHVRFFRLSQNGYGLGLGFRGFKAQELENLIVFRLSGPITVNPKPQKPHRPYGPCLATGLKGLGFRAQTQV